MGWENIVTNHPIQDTEYMIQSAPSVPSRHCQVIPLMELDVAFFLQSLDWSPWFLRILPFLFLLTSDSFGELGFIYYMCRLADTHCRVRLSARD